MHDSGLTSASISPGATLIDLSFFRTEMAEARFSDRAKPGGSGLG
jgi:hypothetical protein